MGIGDWVIGNGQQKTGRWRRLMPGDQCLFPLFIAHWHQPIFSMRLIQITPRLDLLAQFVVPGRAGDLKGLFGFLDGFVEATGFGVSGGEGV